MANIFRTPGTSKSADAPLTNSDRGADRVDFSALPGAPQGHRGRSAPFMAFAEICYSRPIRVSVEHVINDLSCIVKSVVRQRIPVQGPYGYCTLDIRH